MIYTTVYICTHHFSADQHCKHQVHCPHRCFEVVAGGIVHQSQHKTVHTDNDVPVCAWGYTAHTRCDKAITRIKLTIFSHQIYMALPPTSDQINAT